jgi:hypothetical protein
MAHEDYFKREVDKLGKVLATALADLLNLKSAHHVGDKMEFINHVFQTQLDISISSLTRLSDEELLKTLKEKKLTNTHLELIADILTETSGIEGSKEALNLAHKALLIYNHVAENEKTFSLQRHDKMQKLKFFINSDN